MKQPVERRLAAILAADVAGYSQLMGADEEGTLERLKAHRRQLVDPKIREHRGRIVKTTGDGMLVEFPSVVDAVRCAVEVQRAMIDRNAETPEDNRITFRIGVNLGDVIIDGGDIFGDGVNVAARLEALAEPGGISISGTVHEHVGDRLPYAFENMGQQSVKNIARPVHVYAMSAAAAASLPQVARPPQPTPVPYGIAARVAALVRGGTGRWRARPNAPRPTDDQTTPPVASVSETGKPALPSTAPRLSIVVLPLANLSNDPEQEYFVDAITDDLTTDLTRISGSFVISRTTAFSYKNKPVDVRQIGRELGVRYVLEGSVRRLGEQVQVNVQLIDAENGAHLWADRFDTDRINLANAQSEITSRLARTLQLELAEAVGRQIEQEGAVNLDARDLIMRGWAWFWRPLSAANRQQARQAFEQALEIDPGSVDARVGIATILGEQLALGWSTSREQDITRSEKLLLEVLECDRNDPRARHELGRLRRIQNRLIEAQIELEKAIALDRNNSGATLQLGVTLMFMGEPEAALPHVEKALRLNPRYQDVFYYYYWLGYCHLLMGHANEAVGLFRKCRAAYPEGWFTHLYLAAALGLRGDIDEARTALAHSIKLKSEFDSIARLRAAPSHSAMDNPQFVALREKTLEIGLRRAGLPEE